MKTVCTVLILASISALAQGSDLEDWLGRTGLLEELPVALLDELLQGLNSTNPKALLNWTHFDKDDHVKYREELAEFDRDLALRWDQALLELNLHLQLPLEEPWLPWNALFLNQQCSAIGLRGSVTLPGDHQEAKIAVYSDFDMLKSVVIGRADHFQIPPLWSEGLMDDEDAFYETGVIENPVLLSQVAGEGFGLLGAEYPQDIIQDMNDSLEDLAQQLKARGVEVLRAEHLNDQTADTGLKGHSARDLMIMIGDTLFLSPTPFTSRSHEVDEVYMDVITHVKQEGGKVVDLRGSSYWRSYNSGYFLRKGGEEPTDIPLTEAVPLFDAANVFVLNERAVVYLVSISGNRAGAELLQAHVAPMGMSVVTVEGAYYGTHIDTTILPLSDKKILYNKDSLSRATMQELFAPHGYDGPDPFIGVGMEDFVPVKTAINPEVASNCIAMNLLQLSSETVVVEATQVHLKEILESHGFEVMTVSMPWTRDFGGSLHCATCPLNRLQNGQARRNNAASPVPDSNSQDAPACDASPMI